MTKKIIGIALLVIILVAIFLVTLNRSKNIHLKPNPTPDTVEMKGEKFQGKVTAYDTGCFADGICSVTVDNKVVIITIGFRQEKEVGKLTGVESIGDLENNIGSMADVYALKQANGTYTLYGNGDYYVNVFTGDVNL